MKHLRLLSAALLLGMLLPGVGSWLLANQLVAPQPTTVVWQDANIPHRDVSIPVGNSYVKGWWLEGKPHQPSILLLHGIRANRLSMLNRAIALHKRGYAVLLIDLQAHGESPGDMITLGLRESAGVQAAEQWLRTKRLGSKVGVIGVSLGGASILLGDTPSHFDAVVLEAVYTDVRQAIHNRLAIRLGATLAAIVSPLLELQIEPRIHVPPERLRPLDRIADIRAPVLIVAGEQDQHTLLTESQLLYEHAAQPKAMWVVQGAAHQDFFAWDVATYTDRVFGFLKQHL